MSKLRILARLGIVVLLGATLSACVIRPLGWGDRDGRGRGSHHEGGDRGSNHDSPRDEGRRRG